MELCARKDVPAEQTWDLSLLFPTEEEIWKALDEVKAEVLAFAETYAGKLTNAHELGRAGQSMYGDRAQSYYDTDPSCFCTGIR